MKMQRAKEQFCGVDLGCGSSKPEGFIGIDRMEMPGVDIVGDLDGVLPLEDNSVDLLYASHSLEHARDIMHTMREVFRVCKHGAQVCIVAPYNDQKLNLANPYHLNVFNEHTPRFWTNSPVANVDQSEYWHPHATKWGLAESDNSDPGIDFRLARMEFFYFPQYLSLSPEARGEARRRYFDVCDQIVFHLLVWKREEPAEDELQGMIASMHFFEPAYITARREKDGETERMLYATGLGMKNSLPSLSQSGVPQQEVDRLEKQVRSLTEDFEKLKTELMASQANAIKGLTIELNTERAKVAEYSRKLIDLEEEIAACRRSAMSADASLSLCGPLLEQAWIDALASAHEVSLFRRRRIVKFLERIAGKGLRQNLSAPYSHLLEGLPANALVCYGPDLRNEVFAAYKLAAPRPGVEAIEVGLVQAICNLEETVGIEIVNDNNEIIWHEVQNIDGKAGSPIRFPVSISRGEGQGEFEIRLFSGSKFGPVYPLEVVVSRLSRSRQILARWCYS